ncbi:hypothetical protein OG426_53840 [Streptomyces canus]|uniref:hypothetical protein n=1 Tax=Streptomyces canus TaxID=58343 RepID=UPI0022551A27|nr:hypothetical protein [Streptomyces canus]MCX4853870.1 hypothetical protein [Streptomyces canus]WSW40665.1 hypothetical protein OG426_53840 [Streptomyces canus]
MTLVNPYDTFTERLRLHMSATGEVVLDFFVRGGAAPFDQAAQHGPGAGHHDGDGVEQHPLPPALPQALTPQALRARPGHRRRGVQPTARKRRGLRPCAPSHCLQYSRLGSRR